MTREYVERYVYTQSEESGEIVAGDAQLLGNLFHHLSLNVRSCLMILLLPPHFYKV